MHRELDVSFELLNNFTPDNATGTIVDNLIKMMGVYKHGYKNILVSISGGSDSDILLDICKRFDPYSIRTKYLWIDTGLEYQATKDHIQYLERRYGIEICKMKAKMPIPLAVKEYGQPFVSKQVSEYMHRLQLNNFKWEDESFVSLIQKYPNCDSALRWWCDMKGKGSRFSIRQNSVLKEFIMNNPPDFPISNMCCQKAKKDTAAEAYKLMGTELAILGVRKAEGGARSGHNNCFTTRSKEHVYDTYRPLFWWKHADKRTYKNGFGICNSRCYSEYGLKRTGCVGCPFNRDFEEELEICDKHEPKLANACHNIFHLSYEYTRKYQDFIRNWNNRTIFYLYR